MLLFVKMLLLLIYQQLVQIVQELILRIAVFIQQILIQLQVGTYQVVSKMQKIRRMPVVQLQVMVYTSTKLVIKQFRRRMILVH